jgi:hypothetical protein
MPILVNKNTTQTPLTAAGRTGSQVVRLIPAPRIYVKAVDSTTAAPVQTYYTVSNGTTPTGWTDLGIVSGNAKVIYDKKTAMVKTGIDDYMRSAYVQSKEARIEFDLSQFDDSNIELLTGFTGSVITSGSIVNYQVGQEDLVQKAILVIFQNKLDQKEFQFYNPNAYLNFVFAEGNEGMVLRVTGLLPSFTASGQTAESFLSTTIFKV